MFALIGMPKTPVLKKHKNSCGKCGLTYEAKPRRTGRKWKLKVGDDVYVCTPYTSRCKICGCDNEFDYAEKQK